MKKQLTVIFLLLIVTVGLTASPDWVLLTEEWMKRNPESLPVWLTPEELTRLDEIGTRINPTDPPDAPVRAVAEFEPMSGVLIRYPLGIPYSLIQAMSQHVTVVTILTQNNYNAAVNNYTNNGVNMDNCEFIIAPTNSYWTRDYGPFYVFDGNNEMGAVNFSYNRPRPLDDNIPVVFANHFDMPLFGMNISHTGGNYMTNGYGTAASTNIVYSENSSLSNAEVDQFVENYLGITDHIVVADPTGTYIHHIDCWAKFLAPDKILIRSVPSTHSQYQQIENTVNYFAGLTSSYGTPYRIYRVYTPNNQPYTNSLILNDRVYVPIVNSTWDNPALTVYEEAMPGYQIIGVYSSAWQSTDALHCRTKEIADRGMLYIRHYPLLEEQTYSSSYEINAYIFPYSGEPLYPDSLRVYYRINSEGYQNVLLNSTGDNYYAASITEFAAGDTISYYISAADASGRNANHPFIGAPDPHVFVINADGVPPSIYHEPYTEVYISEIPLIIEAEVTDPTGISYVELEYRINGGSVEYDQFDFAGDNSYLCDFGYELVVGDFVEYKIVAADNEEPVNISFCPPEGWHSFTLDILQVESPYFSPRPGEYEEAVSVIIETGTGEAVIYYTLDSSTPDENSAIYDEPLLIEETTTITAIAMLDSYLPSEVMTAEYIIESNFAGDVPHMQVTKLHPAFPNPFNPVVNISYSLSKESQVILEVFNVKGKRVAILVNGFQRGGEHRVIWDGKDYQGSEAAAGVYFYRLKTDEYESIRKMILLK